MALLIPRYCVEKREGEEEEEKEEEKEQEQEQEQEEEAEEEDDDDEEQIHQKHFADPCTRFVHRCVFVERLPSNQTRCTPEEVSSY